MFEESHNIIFIICQKIFAEIYSFFPNFNPLNSDGKLDWHGFLYLILHIAIVNKLLFTKK